MAKGDSGETGQLITNQNEARVQPAQDLNVQRTGTMYNNMNQNYGAGVNQNLPDYSGIMDSYRSFLSGGAPSGGSSGGYNPSQNRGMTGDYNPFPTSLPSINAGQQSNINQASRNNLGNNGLPIGNNGPGQAIPAPPGTPRQPPQGGMRPGGFGSNTPNMSADPSGGGQGLAGNNPPASYTGSAGASQVGGGNTLQAKQQSGGLVHVGGNPDNPANYRGTGPGGGPQLANDFSEIAKGLPSAAAMNDNKDHSGANMLADGLRAKGYDVQDGLVDKYGRMDSLMVNGQLYRINDSSGNWNLKSNEGGDAWEKYSPGDPGYQGGGGGIDGSGPSGAVPGWQDMAMTGGFTPQGIQDIRARAIAPTRAIYENAQNDLKTQMARTGGYMPNYAAAQADLARKSNYGVSDANISANAGIAQMIQQGRMQGLQGLTGAQLGALQGMTGMFGASPGLAGTFGNQVLGANQQNLGLQSLQNQESDQLVNQKVKQSQIPSNYQQALGNIGGTVGVAGKIAMMGAGMSSIKYKENIVPAEVNILDKLKKLTIYNWNYKAEIDPTGTRHIGPMAEEFKEVFGVGNGEDIALIDVMGIMLATCKALAESR
jgi:hypothetical protein